MYYSLKFCHNYYIFFVTDKRKNKRMEPNTVIAQIKKRISQKKPGTIFTARDFQDIAGSSAIRQSLKRLVENGTIRRLAHGLYDRPMYSLFLKEHEEADMYQAAQYLARSNNWTIAPSGNIALNLLGLSTQVSSSWSFVSDGPYRTYTIGSNILEFKHRTNREITGMSNKTLLIIQALKALGKERITDDYIARIQNQLTESEKKNLLIESKYASTWLIRMIQKICGDA